MTSKQDQQTRSTTSPARQAGPSQRNEKTHICRVCPKRYTTSSGLIEHYKSIHPDQDPDLIAIAAKIPVPPKKPNTFVNPYVKKKSFSFEVNDRISTPEMGHGTLRYLGPVHFAKGTWAGVELDRPEGDNDGSINNKRYFECRQKHGLFLPLDKLIKLQESPVTQDRTDSGNVHFHDLSPGNGSSNVISQQSPGQAKKRSAPLRCNDCEGCERNQKGEDCQECRYCKDKRKNGGRNTLRKPCEKKTCTGQIRPSFKDDNGALHIKRTQSEIAVEEQSIVQEPSMKKKKWADSADCEDRFTLKLEKEQVEEKLKRSEREKQRLEKSLIQARASANKAKTDLEKKEIENTTIKNQIKDLQQELKDSKETEEKFKVQKEKLDNDKDKMIEKLDQIKAIVLDEIPQSIRNEDKRGKQDIYEVHRESAPTMLRDCRSYPGPYCDICHVTEHNTEDCPQQSFESVFTDGVAQIEYPVVSSIPEPVIAAIPVPLPTIDKIPIVYFDLETTGLGRQSHITQIAAKNTAGQSFNTYVIPKKIITQGAAKTSGNKFEKGKFYYNDRQVLAITISQALTEFLRFIGDKPVILSGHNIKTFDCHVLLNALKSCKMQKLFEKKVAGFLDTISLFRCRTVPSYKQEELYKRLIGGTYDAHNALEDVLALEKLINKINPSSEEKRKHTFSVQYVLDVQENNRNAATNLVGWKELLEEGVISKNIAQKAAKSGLRPEHLELSYRCGREDAIYSVLSQPTNAGVRVTKDKKISKQLSDYYENKLLERIQY